MARSARPAHRDHHRDQDPRPLLLRRGGRVLPLKTPAPSRPLPADSRSFLRVEAAARASEAPATSLTPAAAAAAGRQRPTARAVVNRAFSLAKGSRPESSLTPRGLRVSLPVAQRYDRAPPPRTSRSPSGPALQRRPSTRQPLLSTKCTSSIGHRSVLRTTSRLRRVRRLRVQSSSGPLARRRIGLHTSTSPGHRPSVRVLPQIRAQCASSDRHPDSRSGTPPLALHADLARHSAGSAHGLMRLASRRRPAVLAQRCRASPGRRPHHDL